MIGATATAAVAASATPCADEVLVRLRRIEGQVRGLQRMYTAGRSGSELLDQVAAVRAALSGVGLLVVEAETREQLSTVPGAPAAAEILELVRRLVGCR